MEKIQILKYILYAKTNKKDVNILTKNNKKLVVSILDYEPEGEMVKYKFLNNNDSKIKIESIVEIQFEKKEDEKEFLYKSIEQKYNTANLKERVKKFESYYLEIIDELLSKEKKDSKGYINLNSKKRIYPEIFENLTKDVNNLLFYYFTRKHFEKTNTSNVNNVKEILLIEQANLSQKKALDYALNERISIIQGPPGTGKTTTIINILANLLYENKKVLVVSKNNSAIENVAEELSTMNIPKCYIRMRKLRHNERTSRAKH